MIWPTTKQAGSSPAATVARIANEAEAAALVREDLHEAARLMVVLQGMESEGIHSADGAHGRLLNQAIARVQTAIRLAQTRAELLGAREQLSRAWGREEARFSVCGAA